MKVYQIFLVGVFLEIGSAASILHLPKYIKPCKVSDPNFNTCALKNTIEALPTIIKGDKQLKSPNWLPLKLPLVEVDAGQNLELTFKPAEVSGIEGLQVKAVDIDLKNHQFDLRGHIPRLNIDGIYTMNGRILVLPIQGEGKANITFVEGDYNYKFSWEEVEKNGKTFMKIRNPSFDYVLQKATFNFENLFNGNKQLGDEMNRFLNENWKEIMADLGKGFGNTIQFVISETAKAFMEKIPLQEIFPQ